MKNDNNQNNSELQNLKKFIIDEKRKLIRGPKGKFVSLKKLEKEKQLPIVQPTEIVFYPHKVRKFIVGDRVFFALEDILNIGKPLPGELKIKFTSEFEKEKEKLIKTIGKIEVAAAHEILRLIQKVKGEFPGPLSRWLLEQDKT